MIININILNHKILIIIKMINSIILHHPYYFINPTYKYWYRFIKLILLIYSLNQIFTTRYITLNTS